MLSIRAPETGPSMAGDETAVEDTSAFLEDNSSFRLAGRGLD
jgi:hypothetical protein